MVLMGDSTSVALWAGVEVWAAEVPDRQVTSVAAMGCGLIRGTAMMGDDSGVFVKSCGEALGTKLPSALSKSHADVAVIMVTIPDISMRQWHKSEGMLRPVDDRYRTRMLDDYRAQAQQLIDAGVRHIEWVVPPQPADWWLGWASENYSPDGWQRLADVIDTVALEHPGVVDVVHLDHWFEDTGAYADPAMREDGLHLTPEGALTVMDQFLGPVLLRLTTL